MECQRAKGKARGGPLSAGGEGGRARPGRGPPPPCPGKFWAPLNLCGGKGGGAPPPHTPFERWRIWLSKFGFQFSIGKAFGGNTTIFLLDIQKGGLGGVPRRPTSGFAIALRDCRGFELSLASPFPKQVGTPESQAPSPGNVIFPSHSRRGRWLPGVPLATSGPLCSRLGCGAARP